MKILTVSELVRETKANLESLFPDAWVEGEISNINCHSSGHCYFTLKDAGAQLSAVLFRDDFSRLKFRPTNGLQVIIHGRLTIYPPQGRFQMIAVGMEPKGKGGLQLAYEQLKAKLEKEGLFAEERKRPIPALPQAVGIITSLDGAALHDMLNVLNRRFAGLRILIHPAKVQGEGAGRDVAEAIKRLNRDFPELDVLLVGRGGGSIEDLWAFNEEVVARAIFDSAIPVISCVGHETDFTIADFVADLRAPTPSAAAELVIRAKADLAQQLDHAVSRLENQMRFQLSDLSQRLQYAMESRMLVGGPQVLIDDYRQEIDGLRERLTLAIANQTEHWEKDLAHLAEKLHLLSPLATLSRSYAIAWKLPERRVITRADHLKPKDHVEVQVHEGRFYAEIERTEV